MYKIVLQTLFGSRHIRGPGYINLYRRVCTQNRAYVRERAQGVRTRERTPTRDIVRLRADSRPLVVSYSYPPRRAALRRMRYNLDIPYIHVQDMPPILNIPSCNS